MRCQEFFLTDDAVDDLVELEAYVLTYQNIRLVEVLEDRFFETFHGLLATASLIIRYEVPSQDAQPYREGERLRR